MNRRAHAVGSGLAVSLAVLIDGDEGEAGGQPQTQLSTKAVTAGGFAALCGSLPDVLEPATHPGHRQFFHSVAFAAMLGFGLYRTYQWQTEDPIGRLLRGAVLVVGSAYLVHLAMDATTPRSLPLVGRL